MKNILWASQQGLLSVVPLKGYEELFRKSVELMSSKKFYVTTKLLSNMVLTTENPQRRADPMMAGTTPLLAFRHTPVPLSRPPRMVLCGLVACVVSGT